MVLSGVDLQRACMTFLVLCYGRALFFPEEDKLEHDHVFKTAYRAGAQGTHAPGKCSLRGHSSGCSFHGLKFA